MVPPTNLLAFALAALLLIAVPGPSVLFVIGRTLALGRKGGLLSVLGNAIGELLQIATVALGVVLVLVLAQSLLLFSVARRTSSTSESKPSGTAEEVRRRRIPRGRRPPSASSGKGSSWAPPTPSR